MFLSPGHSPRHLSPPSPSPSPSFAAAAAAAAPHGKTLAPDSTSTTNSRKRGPSVLDEDTYVVSLERIIERDFFPDIPKLRDRSDWLQALRSGDPVLIRDAQLKILERRSASVLASASSSKTPSSSRRSASSAFFPASSTTPFPHSDKTPSIPHPTDHPPTLSQPDSSISLDQFLHRYTSEDNASFSKILDKVNRKRRHRVSHLLEGETQPLLEDAERDRITDGYGTSGQPVSSLDGCKYTAKNLLMYIPTHEVPLTEEEIIQRATAATKEIDRSNTRFHGKPAEDSNPAKEDTAAAILYTPVPGTTPAGAVWPFADRDAERSRKYDLEDLRKTPNPFYVEAAKKAENGYSYLKTPSPAPGVDESPFMTWGEIEGTPLRLDFEDTPVDISGSSDGPQFRIQQPPSRDVKAHSLSREAARKLREWSRMFQKPPLPSPVRRGSASPNMRTLSPAAQKFYQNAIAKSSRSSVDETLRASYRGASPVMGTPKEQTSTPKERTGLTRFSRDGSLGSRSPSARRGSTPPW